MYFWHVLVPYWRNSLTIGHNTFNLAFTMECSSEKIAFLDVTIYKDEHGNISRGLFHKPTAGNTLLHTSSSHPKLLINSIHYGQYVRLKRNCFCDEDFQCEAMALRGWLLERGYSKKSIKKAFNQAKMQTRQSLLFFFKPKSGPPCFESHHHIFTST